MKFLHLSDLHLGKCLFGFSLLEDQKYILEQILRMAQEQAVDVVLLAGDIYDRSVPSAEAVRVLDDFLTALIEKGMKICMISGNHDSALRLEYGSRLFPASHLYIHSLFQEPVQPVSFTDAWGTCNVWMVPFIRPADRKDPENRKQTYTEMFEGVLAEMDRKPGERHILMAHQFFTGASTCDSEEVTIGTLDNISTDRIQDFDYGAFGHLHSPQKVGSDHCRYSGTPLKYSISEAGHVKSVPLITMEEDVTIELLPLQPRHDLRDLSGTLQQLTDPAFVREQETGDYIFFTLEDEMERVNAMEQLRACYPNALGMRYAFLQKEESLETLETVENLSPLEIISGFYQKQKGMEMNEEQLQAVLELWQEKEE